MGKLTAFEASVIGLADGGGKAALGRYTRDNQVGDGTGLELVHQGRVPKGALAGLVYHHLVRQWFELVDYIVSMLSPNQQTTQRAFLSNDKHVLAVVGCCSLPDYLGRR